MRAPKHRGAPITEDRIRLWLEHFNGFRDSPNRDAIERWISRFDNNHQDIAARILDCTEVVSSGKIRTAFRQLLEALPNWSADEANRIGRWVFVARERSAGESGGTMLHQFRVANGMAARRYDQLFKYVSELPRLGFGRADNIVFIDDFVGTGDQVCRDWEIIRELVTGGPQLYLLLIAIPHAAVRRIENETEYSVVADILLDGRDDIFSPKCRYFTSKERDAIYMYCRRADRRNPKGYGECGLIIVFHHGCPNNTIPILHANKRAWIGLFPRNDFVSRRNT